LKLIVGVEMLTGYFDLLNVKQIIIDWFCSSNL